MKNPDEIISNLNVSIHEDSELEYSKEPPYSPSVRYKEYFFSHINKTGNTVYDAVRNTLYLLNLDKDNYGTSLWNPFKELIKSGNTVVVKPNFVVSRHSEEGNLFSIITHPSVIRVVIDYVYIALGGKGRIIIADAPQMDCNFSELLNMTKLESISELYKNELDFNIEIYDLRSFWLDTHNGPQTASSGDRHKLPGDPLGSLLVNLGDQSLFYGIKNYKSFYGADYNRDETVKHHHGKIQQYLISKTIMSADAVISVPKLKVHKKVGVTLNAKGLVGIVVNKNCLVHYTLGSPEEGGDQFPDNLFNRREASLVKLQRWAYDTFLAPKTRTGNFLYGIINKFGKIILKPLGFRMDKKKHILDYGNWYGNDSAWRMVIDLLRIFIYSNKDGRLQSIPMRRVFSIVDGVIGGEKNGPLCPDDKRVGLIIAGFNPCAVDLVCTRLMGFDCKKLKVYSHILRYPDLFKIDIERINVFSRKKFNDLFNDSNKNKYHDFVPHPGWKGFVEL